MSAKKISQLVQKTTLQDNDAFVIVDSATNDNKKVDALSIKNYIGSVSAGDMFKSVYDTNNNGIVDNSERLNNQLPSFYLDRSNHTGTQTASTISDLIEIWNLSQFQSNSTLVLPLGKRIYLRRSDGFVTGVYKLGDGVTQLGQLNWFMDDWEVLPGKMASACTQAFQRSFNVFNTTLNSFLISNCINFTNGANSTETNAMRGSLMFIPFPMRVYGLGSFVQIFSSVGSLSYALYRVNMNFTATKIAEIINTNNIISIGLMMYNLSTPINIEPGIYGIYYLKIGGQFAATRISNHQSEIFLIGANAVRYDYFVQSFSSFPSSLTFPLSGVTSSPFKYELFLNASIIK